MKPIIDNNSLLAKTALEHVRRHRPLVTGTGIVCATCTREWMCTPHDTAEHVLRAAGLKLSEHDRCDQ